MTRKHVMSMILEHLAEHGRLTTKEIYNAIEGLDIPKATFYRAVKELANKGVISRCWYEAKSGKTYTDYRINIHAIPEDPFRNH